MSPNKEIQVTLYEIKRVENGRPVCDNKPYPSTIRMNEKLEMLFNKWQKRENPKLLFVNSSEFLLYQRRHDEPETGMTSGGGQSPNKGAIRLKGDQTPEQVHMQDGARIFVKREDLQCSTEQEPQVA